MINQLDETIRKLVLARGNLDADSVMVSFDQPTGDWAAGLTRPTIDFYLFDIRENIELRSQEWLVERDGNGQTHKRLAPLRYDLTYLVTVWTQNQVEDEHAILWRVLGALASAPTIPQELLEPSLRNQPYPILARTAQPSRAIENLPDLWGVMENQLRPSINYVVTLAMEREVAFTSPWVVSKRIDLLDRLEPGSGPETIHQIGGIVYRAEGGQAVADAEVTLVETGAVATTDRFGRYRFANVPGGALRLRVRINGSASEHAVVTPSQDLTQYDLRI
jgi:hypothetical protein